MARFLTLKYAGVHSTYWMYYGVISSFASVYLLAKEYTNSEIGVILALGNVVAVIMQPLVADFADRSRRFSLTGISQFLTLILLALSLIIMATGRKAPIMAVAFVLATGLTAVLQPLFNSMCMKLQLLGGDVNFGLARGMGSCGYAVLCAIMGSLVEFAGVDILPVSGIVTGCMLFGCLMLIKASARTLAQGQAQREAYSGAATTGGRLEVPKTGAAGGKTLRREEPEEINLIDFIKRNRVFMIINLGVLGIFFSNSIFNNYMMQILQEVGGTSKDMGQVFALMAFLEIPVMLVFGYIRRYVSCQLILKIASIFFVLKIFVCYMAKSVATIYAIQFFQLVSFALFLPAMVVFINEIMDQGEAVKGQAFYTTTITVTTVISSLVGGVILDLSGARMLTLVATIVTLIGALIVCFSVDKVKAVR